MMRTEGNLEGHSRRDSLDTALAVHLAEGMGHGWNGGEGGHW